MEHSNLIKHLDIQNDELLKPLGQKHYVPLKCYPVLNYTAVKTPQLKYKHSTFKAYITSYYPQTSSRVELLLRVCSHFRLQIPQQLETLLQVPQQVEMHRIQAASAPKRASLKIHLTGEFSMSARKSLINS